MGVSLVRRSMLARSTFVLARRGLIQSSLRFSSTEPKKPRILVTGSCGQVGVELVAQLRAEYGQDNVISTDIIKPRMDLSPYAYANVLDERSLDKLVVDNRIDWVIHNSSILSAVAEKNHLAAFDLNFIGFRNILEVARRHQLRLFAPSSIAAFGISTPLDNVPDLTIQRPSTLYGVSKVYLELLGEYYCTKFGVDFRSLRYPGIISASPPGGGTTDYAVDIFFSGIRTGKYECFLREDTLLPMMYMPDCIKGTIDILKAPSHLLKQQTYNIASFSITPKDLEEELRKHIPNLEVTYKPDFRQQIADSWPKRLDDTNARNDWNWKESYSLSDMTADMITKLRPMIKS